MTFKNFKTNWFHVALMVLLVIAIIRQKLPLIVQAIPFLNESKTEKITDKGSAQLGLFGKRAEGAAMGLDAAQAGEFVRR